MAKQNGHEIDLLTFWRGNAARPPPERKTSFYDVLKIDRAAEGEGGRGFRLVTVLLGFAWYEVNMWLVQYGASRYALCIYIYTYVYTHTHHVLYSIM